MGMREKPISRDRENKEEIGFDAAVGRPIETAVLGECFRHS